MNATRHALAALGFMLLPVGAIGAETAAAPDAVVQEVFEPAAAKGSAVIVISGRSGRERYRDYAAKLAALGYYAVLIDGNEILFRPEDARGRDGAASLRAVIASAQGSPRALAGKVALVGFSLGGGGALLHGTSLQEHVSAVVAYYPSITVFGPDMAPLASRLTVPVLVLAGERDRYFNCCLIETMRDLEAAARARQAQLELVVYPQADHGFNLNVPTFRADDADDAWRRATAFLESYTKVAPPGSHDVKKQP